MASSFSGLSIVLWKWKPKPGYRSSFGPETVNIMAQMIKRNYPHRHRVICTTDDPTGIDPNIKIVPLWDDWKDIPNPHGEMGPSCYRRLRMFAPDAEKLFGKRFVSLDLDTVILGDMSEIWNVKNDIKLYGDTNPDTYFNGSMLLMTAGARPKVWDNFDPVKSPKLSKAAGQFGSDQGWISYCLGPNEAKWTTADGVYSFRQHLRHKPGATPPANAKIVMFHGTTDPWSTSAASFGWVKRNWRYHEYTKVEAIEAVNVAQRMVLFTSGRKEPITAIYDAEGKPATPHTAVSFVCGRGKEFWPDLVHHYRKTIVH